MPQKPTILCVDDEKTVLDGLKEQLTRTFLREYAIECAENGQRALEIYHELVEEQIEIPVIISDYIMPGMKGDELLKEIYKLDPRIRKILLTGQADADAVGRAVNYANLYRYLSKPWEQNDLILTVQEAIRSYHQDKTLQQQNVQLKEINEKLEILNEKLKQKIELFNKFVPNQFLNILHIDLEKKASEGVTSQEYIELSQAAERELTIMFADIRSFTTICESLSSAEAFQFVNGYLNEMGPIILQHNGFIDKFIGDAIMSLFLNADDAVKAAIAMHRQLAVYNKNLEQAGKKPIAIGVGLNTGILMLGTVGDVNRLQTTVIGDAVNLTARTEKLTKDFTAQVIITGNTYKSLADPTQYKIRFLDLGQVRGKKQPIEFYKILDTITPEKSDKELEINDAYQKGVMQFQKGELEQAKAIFEECLKIYPDDYASQLYLRKINPGAQS